MASQRFLLVEDEPSFRETLRKHLGRRGFDVVTAKDAETALRLVRESPPDLLCLDLHLPRQSGYELCEAIRREPGLGAVPIILMGTDASPEARAFAEDAGADGYVVKPFSLADLDAEIDRLTPGRSREA